MQRPTVYPVGPTLVYPVGPTLWRFFALVVVGGFVRAIFSFSNDETLIELAKTSHTFLAVLVGMWGVLRPQCNRSAVRLMHWSFWLLTAGPLINMVGYLVSGSTGRGLTLEWEFWNLLSAATILPGALMSAALVWAHRDEILGRE